MSPRDLSVHKYKRSVSHLLLDSKHPQKERKKINNDILLIFMENNLKITRFLTHSVVYPLHRTTKHKKVANTFSHIYWIQ